VKKDPPEYIPAESAEVSGTYELLNFAGTPTGQTCSTKKGRRFLPLRWVGRGA
jgi:hypothetical protein